MSELNLSNKVRMTFLSAALSLAALGVAFTQLAHGKSGKSETKAEPPKVLVDSTPIKRDTKLTTSFAPVIKRVAPSVVNVFISSTPKNVSWTPQFDEPFFRHFFGDDFSPGNRRGKQVDQIARP